MEDLNHGLANAKEECYIRYSDFRSQEVYGQEGTFGNARILSNALFVEGICNNSQWKVVDICTTTAILEISIVLSRI